MQTENQLKALVKEKYASIAEQSRDDNASSCCGAGGCSTEVYNIMTDDYTDLKGYNSEADLGLGCGLPTAFAKIKEGDIVIDLGSGAGNDCFVARAATGPTGIVIGIDFTEQMIAKARMNAEKLNYHNVEFRLGDIEQMPVAANMADVIVSNCVLNLVPNKFNVLSEVFRVLKPGGHFSISDIVLEGQLPLQLKQAAEMYAGCVSGAIQQTVYMELIAATGFTNITIQKSKEIIIPDDILINYLTKDEIAQFRNNHTGIYSITVYGDKPLENKTCCEPGSGCC